MIDTVRLRSPYLDDDTARSIERVLFRRSAVKESTGEVRYVFTSDSLSGSWDNRIQVAVKREEFRDVAIQTEDIETMPSNDGSENVEFGRLRYKSNWMLRSCDPYLIVEGSVHKAMSGHNITGGPISFQPAAEWFVDLIEELLAEDDPFLSLPNGLEWWVERVDWAECYGGTFEGWQDYMYSLEKLKMPRRKVQKYEGESVFCGGTTTAFKAYLKGIEFMKHDRKVLRHLVSDAQLKALGELAHRVLRVETSIKVRKFKNDFGRQVQVKDVDETYLSRVHFREVGRFLKEVDMDLEEVRISSEVLKRLQSKYSGVVALNLYSLWSALSTLGEREAMDLLCRSEYYRKRSMLVDAGVRWTGTDLVKRHSTLPEGFSLATPDCRQRCAVESLEVIEALAPYRRLRIAA